MTRNMSVEGLAAPRLFELDEKIERREVEDLVDEVSAYVIELLVANLEHWTDDDGLHVAPFQKDFEDELPAVLREALTRSSY